MKKSQEIKIAIVGGGASGIFSSLRCAEVAKENNIKVDIRVFEASKNFLKKGKDIWWRKMQCNSSYI